MGCNSRVLTVTGVFSLVADVCLPELLILLFKSGDDENFAGEIGFGGDGTRSLMVPGGSSFMAPY